jgi:hypothetical protein
VLDHRRERRAVGASHEVPEAHGDLGAVDVVLAAQPQHLGLHLHEAHLLEARAEDATRAVQEIEVRRRRGHRHAVHHGARAQERPVEALAVVGADRGGARHAHREALEQRALFTGLAQEELLETQRLVLEPSQSNQERKRASPAREARRLGVEEEHAREVEVGERVVERERRERLRRDGEGTRDGRPTMAVRGLEVARHAMQRPARRLFQHARQRLERRRRGQPLEAPLLHLRVLLRDELAQHRDALLLGVTGRREGSLRETGPHSLGGSTAFRVAPLRLTPATRGRSPGCLCLGGSEARELLLQVERHRQ